MLEQKNTVGKFITNAEAHLEEPRQISAMELFVLNVFARKSIIDFRLGSKYASVIEEVAFSKILKFSQKITILEYSFSNVVGLKEKCNSNFCVAPKNRLVKITQKK